VGTANSWQMGPIRGGRKGWHVPGYNYLGPFTDLNQPAKPVNRLDEVAQRHDRDYADDRISTEEADRKFREGASKEGLLGKAASGVFAVKGFIDKHTGYASDAIFRPGMSNANKKRQQHYRINQHYANKKPRHTDQDYDNVPDEVGDEEMANIPEPGGGGGDAPMDQVDGGGGRGGGGDMGGGGSGENMSPDRHMGKLPSRYTKTYEKSFVSYINNGVDAMTWKQNAGTTAALPSVEWNEGFQIVPWGLMMSSISPQDYAQLISGAKRWRVKSCGVH